MESPAPVGPSNSPNEAIELPNKANSNNGDPPPFAASPSLGEYRKPDYNYPALAEQVGTQAGLAIFRRFATLNAKNLLYLQAEIAELERQLEEQEAFDQNNPRRREYQWIANDLMNAPPGEDRQWQKVLEIRAKLKEYNNFLLQQAQLHQLSGPNPYDLNHLRDWLHRTRYGARFLDPPEDAWDPVFASDLVALSRRDKEGDVFSRWFSSSLWPFIHRNILHPPPDRTFTSVLKDTGIRIRRGSTDVLRQTHGAVAWIRRRRRTGQTEDAEQRIEGLRRRGTIQVAKTTAEGSVVYEYADARLNRAIEIISILVSSLLPTASIMALNYIPQLPAIWRLGFILGFSAFFTLCLTLFTEARRIEIFAAAVALASVQVVFIGTTANAPGGGG